MSNFGFLGREIIKITRRLTDVTHKKRGQTSQELCKLLYYPQKNPLQQPIAESQLNDDRELYTFETVSESRELVNRNISVVPELPTPDTSESRIVVIFDSFSLSENQALKINMVRFDVFVPLNSWLLEDSIRPFEIIKRIDQLFNGQQMEGLGMLRFERAEMITSEGYAGYAVIYETADYN